MNQISRHRLALVTDTGGNAANTTRSINGVMDHITYKPGDTGVRLDTGAVLTLTSDTGDANLPFFVGHIAPNDKAWAKFVTVPAYDTGGGVIDGSAGVLSFAGEKITASIQGISTDTGREAVLFIYTYE